MKDRKVISGEGGVGGDIVDRVNDVGFIIIVVVVINKNVVDIIGVRVVLFGIVCLMWLLVYLI